MHKTPGAFWILSVSHYRNPQFYNHNDHKSFECQKKHLNIQIFQVHLDDLDKDLQRFYEYPP